MKQSKVAALVDELGLVKAEAARVSKREAQLKEALIDLGIFEVDGSLFRATISRCEREVRDETFKAAAERLILKHLSAQFRSAHTKLTEVTSVRVVARVQAVAA